MGPESGSTMRKKMTRSLQPSSEQVQPLYDEKRGDHAAGEKHREHEHTHEQIAAVKILAGKRIRRKGGEHHADTGAQHGIYNGISIALPDAGVLEYLFVHGKRKALGPERYLAAQQGHGVAERTADDMQQGENDNSAEQDQDRIDHSGKNALPRTLFDFCPLFCPFHYQRLTSLTRLLILLNTMMTMKLMTELNRPTAAEKLYSPPSNARRYT